jgi:23S rRNA G2069 N7-methylase RlmK/C1962 C5-methylase RlmI
MFYFDPDNSDVLFCDKRREKHVLKDRSSKNGSRTLVINPDTISDFTSLPFRNESFRMVVFDPPHLVKSGKTGWMTKKYGQLSLDWRDELKRGFTECLRVLRPSGTLVFKWNENDIPVSKVLSLIDLRPILGNRCGRLSKSHWIIFMKPEKP